MPAGVAGSRSTSRPDRVRKNEGSNRPFIVGVGAWRDMSLLAWQRPPDEGRASTIVVSPCPWSRHEKLPFSEARVAESSGSRRMA